MLTGDYQFVARTSNWRNAHGEYQEQSVLLDIEIYNDRARDHLKSVWEKMRQAVNSHHKLADNEASLPGWAYWKVYEWCTKINGVEDRQKYIAWDGDSIAGFLFLRPGFQSQADPGRHVMYVENIATAPGNKRTELWCRHLKYVGLALLAFSIYQSRAQGFGGNLGLHAADDEARQWYLGLNATRANSLFVPERVGVSAPSPIGDEALERPFFETMNNGAVGLLEEYRAE